jgi:hypothetical protein
VGSREHLLRRYGLSAAGIASAAHALLGTRTRVGA